MSVWWQSEAEQRLQVLIIAQHLSDLVFNLRRWKRLRTLDDARRSIVRGPVLRTLITSTGEVRIHSIPKHDRIKKYHQLRKRKH